MNRAENEHARFLKARYFAGLDGLRCAAILLVIWHHAPRPDALPIMARGFLGVDLFFVLSGFLIATLLLREKAQYGRISLKNFWMRRALRLMPAYYLLLFALLAIHLLLKPSDPDTAALAGGFPVYALYLSNWFHPGAINLGPTWSLATEQQFYLLWPLVEAFAAPFVLIGVWAGAFVVNQAINFGLLDPAFAAGFGLERGEFPEILELTFTPIILGVGLAHLLASARGFALLRTAAGFKYAPAVFAVLLALLMCVPAANLSGAPRLFIHVAMMLLVAAVVLRPESALTRALSWAPIAYVGTVSYGMYLYHLWCLQAGAALVARLGLPAFPTVFIVSALITIGLAAASYFLIEKRFLDLRKKFRTTRAAPIPPPRPLAPEPLLASAAAPMTPDLASPSSDRPLPVADFSPAG